MTHVHFKLDSEQVTLQCGSSPVEVFRQQAAWIPVTFHRKYFEFSVVDHLLQPSGMSFPCVLMRSPPLLCASPPTAVASAQIRFFAVRPDSRIVSAGPRVSLAQRIKQLRSNSPVLSATTFCVENGVDIV